MNAIPISKDDLPFKDLSSFLIFNIKRINKDTGISFIKQRIFKNSKILKAFKRVLIGDLWIESDFNLSKQLEVIETMNEEDFIIKLIDLNSNLDILFNQVEYPQWKIVFCPNYKEDLSLFIFLFLHSYTDGIGLIKLLIQISDESVFNRIDESRVFSFSGQKLLKRYSKERLKIPNPLTHDEFYSLLERHNYKKSISSYSPKPPCILIKRIKFDSAMEDRLNSKLGISFLNLQSAFVYLICRLTRGIKYNGIYTNITLRAIDYKNYDYGNFLSRVIIPLETDEDDLVKLARIHKEKFIKQINENVHLHFYNEFLN